MAVLKGKKEYLRWKEGKPLTRKQAMLAQCYICNGLETADCCGAKSCPMYAYFPYGDTAKNRTTPKKGQFGYKGAE